MPVQQQNGSVDGRDGGNDDGGGGDPRALPQPVYDEEIPGEGRGYRSYRLDPGGAPVMLGIGQYF